MNIKGKKQVITKNYNSTILNGISAFAIKINKEHIWTDAIEEYGLIEF